MMLTKLIELILEGYDYKTSDGILSVRNPDFKEDDGSAPFLVYHFKSQWQPIETAPKNTNVLLFRGDSKTAEIGVAQSKYFGHPEYAHTHWMPLPKGPEQ